MRHAANASAPRRSLRKEHQWLPVLAPRLPLAGPRRPCGSAEPSARFPKPWTVMTWVPGEPLDHASISRGRPRGRHPGGVPQGAPRGGAGPTRRPIRTAASTSQTLTDGFDRTSSRPSPPTTRRRGAGRLGRRRCGPRVGGPAGVGARRPASRERRRLGRNARGRHRLRGHCSPAIRRGTSPPHGCSFPPARAHGSSTRTPGGRGDGPARPRVGGPEEPVLICMGQNGDRGLPGGQADLGTRRPGGARSGSGIQSPAHR